MTTTNKVLLSPFQSNSNNKKDKNTSNDTSIADLMFTNCQYYNLRKGEVFDAEELELLQALDFELLIEPKARVGDTRVLFCNVA